MGYRTKVLGSKKVDLSEGYFIEIRPMDGNESEIAKEILLGGPITGTLDTQSVMLREYTFHEREYQLYLLATCVVAWNIDDDEGQVLPITEETVGILSTGDKLKTISEIRKLNSPLGDDAAKQG